MTTEDLGRTSSVMSTSLTLYAWGTPDGQKPIILLEELGVPYDLVGVDVGRGHQLTSRYLDINARGKIPTLTDERGSETVTIGESGAILLYLAETEGRFMPSRGAARVDVQQWLMYQAATVGPMLGQANHFRKSAPEPIPYAIERYATEARRIFSCVDKCLSDKEFVAGDYSIADMALFPWLHVPAWFGLRSRDFPNVARWVRVLNARAAIQSTLGTRFVAGDWASSQIAV